MGALGDTIMLPRATLAAVGCSLGLVLCRTEGSPLAVGDVRHGVLLFLFFVLAHGVVQFIWSSHKGAAMARALRLSGA